MKPTVLVHGGAGDMDPAREHDALAGCRAAAACGTNALDEGDALAAVIAAVRSLEDNPNFNAGTGSVLTRKGEIEVDAAVMRGSDLAIGAIAAVPWAGNGIEMARAVLEDGEHALLCGQAAWEFLRERGFTPQAADRLVTERSKRRLQVEAKRRAKGVRGEPDPGTVGAVAIDASGCVAAATSTGGTTFKRSGRIGDTPLFGCGTWADNCSAATSATGHGESIIRTMMARVAADASRDGAGAQAGANAAVAALDRVSGKAGIIVVAADGSIGIAHNTKTMPVAWMSLGDAEAMAQTRAQTDVIV